MKFLPLNTRNFAIKRSSARKPSKPAAPPPALTLDQIWTPVTDKVTGGIYYWNTQTNETTHVGAPNPALVQYQPVNSSGVGIMQSQPQSGGMMSGIGGVVAQGMAFGVGSSLAHHAVGSLFGGGGHSSHSAAAPTDSMSPPDSGMGGGDFDSDFSL